MKNISFFFLLFFISEKIFSQASDFIVLKKNDHTVKSFFSGSPIAFETDNGFYSVQIDAIKKDTVYLLQFDIRQIPTNLGIYVVDTVATYHLKFSYKEIIAIEDQKAKGFNWGASGGSLFGGGILLTAVGLGTWAFTKPGTQYHASPYLIAGGAVLAGVGYLLLRSGNGKYKIGKNYTLQYIKVKQTPIP